MHINNIIVEAIRLDYLEEVQRDIILGVEGEKIVNTREFYSVFQTEINFKVVCSGQKIGDIPLTPQIRLDENILLASKIWKIKDIDVNGSKIIVIPANDGKKPMFFGSGGNIHIMIRQKMLRILKSNDSYQELDNNCIPILSELRSEFKNYLIKDYIYDRPYIEKEGDLVIYTFTGTKINESLNFLIRLTGWESILNDQSSSLILSMKLTDFNVLIQDVNDVYNKIDEHLEQHINENESLIGFSKWGVYLPIKYKCEVLKERKFDFKSALELINNINLIKSE